MLFPDWVGIGIGVIVGVGVIVAFDVFVGVGFNFALKSTVISERLMDPLSNFRGGIVDFIVPI